MCAGWNLYKKQILLLKHVLSMAAVFMSFYGMEKLYSIYENDSIGSFYKAEIAHKDDFLNISENEILFRENKGWQEIEITDETGLISFTEQEDENGVYLRCSGSFGLHGPILAISKIMRPYLGRKSVLKLTSLTNEEY